MNTSATSMMNVIGMPTTAKSLNLYPPGIYTSMWVGEPIGVAKLLLTATIRAMQNVIGFRWSVVAVVMAIG